MFNDKLGILEEFLPCKIGDTVYAIDKYINSETQRWHYCMSDPFTCEGFIIEKYDGNIKIRPAKDTWDGWYPLLDDEGLGYFTKEEAKIKVKELNELEELKRQYEWIDNL